MVEVADGAFDRPILYVGRYAIFNAIARGGFASVHLARSFGAGNFARTVAIKRLHRQFAQDPEVGAMFLDEANIVARIRHPNVLPTLDLIAAEDELMIVMEYVEGVTLRYLLRHARKRNRKVPLGVVLRCIVSALRGLHAAHEARDEQGERLNIIHRDVSPDNILIGTDGLVRILDFGVAKALGQYHETGAGEVRGKLAYMTPEQVNDEELSHRSDVFSAAIVLWEAMTAERLFAAKSVTATAHRVLTREVPLPSELAGTPRKLDGIVLQGLERDPAKRWPSAERFAAALEAVGSLAGETSLAQYVRQAGADRIRERAKQIEAVEAARVNLEKLEVPSRASMTEDEIEDKTSSPVAVKRGEMEESRHSVLPRASLPSIDSIPVRGQGAERKDTPTDVSYPSAPRADEGARALLPYVAGALAIIIVVLLFTRGDDETEETKSAAQKPPQDETSVAIEPSQPAPAPSPTVPPAPSTSEPSPPPASAEPAPEPKPEPKPAVRPRPPTGKRIKVKPPPLHGRE